MTSNWRSLHLNHREMLLEVRGPGSPSPYYKVGEPTAAWQSLYSTNSHYWPVVFRPSTVLSWEKLRIWSWYRRAWVLLYITATGFINMQFLELGWVAKKVNFWRCKSNTFHIPNAVPVCPPSVTGTTQWSERLLSCNRWVEWRNGRC